MLANKAIPDWDVAALLKLMWETWNDVFRNVLGPAERGFVGELRGHRNRWAHQESFSSDDAYRALNSVGRLLASVSAPQSDELEKIKMELLRVRFDEQSRGEQIDAESSTPVSGGYRNRWRGRASRQRGGARRSSTGIAGGEATNSFSWHRRSGFSTCGQRCEPDSR